MFELLKKNPWANLVERLTENMSTSIKWLFGLYTILLPLLVVLTHLVENISGLWVTLVMNLCAAVAFYFIPRYLRSGDALLSLDESHRKPPFSIFYHTIVKVGGIFAVIIGSYTTILLIMLGLEQVTGITQSQEIPDLTHMGYVDIFYSAFTAGLTEEVWRIAAIIVTLLIVKKLTGGHWAKKKVQWGALFLSFVITSFVFGWLHTFGYSDSYFSVPITLQIGLIGMVLAGIALLTRRLWLAVFFHFFFDFVSFTLNAKAMHLLTSETAYNAFVEENMMWFALFGYGFFFMIGSFFAAIYLLRYAKGAKKIPQKVAESSRTVLE